MSRIFQAMRGSQKVSVEKPPNPPDGTSEQWPNLRDSLESWSASFERTSGGVPQSATRPSATVGPKPEILGALDQQENPRAGKTFGQFAEPIEQWRDLAAQINLRPEIIPRRVGLALGERLPWWSGSTCSSRVSSPGNVHFSRCARSESLALRRA